MATLAQRLFAQSGMATLGDLPALYGILDPAKARRAAAQGAGTEFQGEPAINQLAALYAAGGGAPGGSPGGGGGFAAPTLPEPISSPGRNPNALRTFMDDRSRSEGGGFGGSAYGNAQREGEMTRRGTAPLTAENMGRLFGNVTGLMSGTGPLTTGFASMAELGLGLPQGELGGIQNFAGYRAFDPDIVDAVKTGKMRLGQAISEQNSRNEQKQARQALDTASRTPGGLNYGDVGMGRRGFNYRGGYRTGGGFGGGNAGASLGRDSSAKQAGTTGAPGVY